MGKISAAAKVFDSATGGMDMEKQTTLLEQLPPDGDVVTAAGVARYLGDLAGKIAVEVLPVCTSTNLVLKERAADLATWHTVIALRQTQGRGRLGRQFYSPEDSGLYMSVLLRPELAAVDAGFITAAAAVAVCRGLESLGSPRTEIKWVNDVLIGGKKVCGILTEAGFHGPSGDLDYAVLGVGINATEPTGGFPPDLAGIAGAAFPRRERDLRNRLAADLLRQLYEIYTALPSHDFVGEYRDRSCLVGKRVHVLRGDTPRPALVQGVDERCRLLVRYDDGTAEALLSGEVSLHTQSLS